MASSINTSIASNYLRLDSTDGTTQLVLNGKSIRVYGFLFTNSQAAGFRTLDFFERDGTTLIEHWGSRTDKSLESNKYFEAVNGLTVVFDSGGDAFTILTLFYSDLQ